MRLLRKFNAHSFPARCAQALLVAMLVCCSLGVTDSQAHFEKLGRGLMCTCGCAQGLMGCDHVGCPNRGGEMDELRSGIASGQSDDVILQGFVERYGKTVLAAPTTQGFDLVAWIMPFAVAAVALIGTILLVRNWAKHQTPAVAASGTVRGRAAEEMQARIRRETETE